MPRRTSARLEVRNAAPGRRARHPRADRPRLSRLRELQRRQVRGQINNFPEGQFVAVFEGAIVGYCASSRIDEAVALAPHDWATITGNGFGSRHDPDRRLALRIEMAVDDRQRGLRIGKRLYDARRALAERLELRGIVFGGRMPGYAPGKSQGRRARKNIWRRSGRASCATGDRLPAGQRLPADRRARRLSARPTRRRGALPRTWSGATRTSTRTSRPRSACRAASKASAWPPSSSRRARSRISPSSCGNVEYFVDVAAGLPGGLRRLSRTVHPVAAVVRDREAVADGGDRPDDRTSRADRRRAVAHGAALQHQHRRRLAPDAHRRRQHPERRLRLPARRLGPRAGEDPPDPQRSLLVEDQGRQTAST